MKSVRNIGTVRRALRATAGPVVLVPTMGGLHDGHAALIEAGRRLAGRRGFVVVSVFVNPAQFGPQEDFSKYPRTLRNDLEICKLHGADLCFSPSATEMYPAGFSTWVNEESISVPLCGGSRPGHFRGVCTVVLKLFNVIQPSAAVFGLKDFQQYLVIRRMVRDLNLPVRIVPVPTVRETDGLALSSRNRFLTPEERAQAPVLRGALLEARSAFRRGETRATALREILLKVLSIAPLARVDYAEIRDAETLAEVATVRRNCVLALAAFFGSTRLIDNLWLR